MTKPKKKFTVLLLSAPIGSGHLMAAEALQEVLTKYDNVEVINGSAFDFFPKILGDAILAGYFGILKHCPVLYKIAYKWSNTGDNSVWLRDFLNWLLSYLAQGYFDKHEPDAVLVTHPTPAGVVSQYKMRRSNKIILGAVITDFSFHNWWIYPGLDYYFVDNALIQAPAALNVPAIVTGIPVRSQFSEEFDRVAWRGKFGFTEKDTVCLLIGGGDGLLPMAQLVRALTEMAPIPGLEMIAVTGRNKKLSRILEQRKLPNIRIFDFTEQLPQLMRSADVVISKAGGLTSAETLTVGAEFILYDPLPGQEVCNSEYLAKHCEAKIAASPKEVHDYVRTFAVLSMEEKNTMRRMRRKAFGKPLAAETIANFLINKLESLDR